MEMPTAPSAAVGKAAQFLLPGAWSVPLVTGKETDDFSAQAMGKAVFGELGKDGPGGNQGNPDLDAEAMDGAGASAAYSPDVGKGNRQGQDEPIDITDLPTVPDNLPNVTGPTASPIVDPTDPSQQTISKVKASRKRTISRPLITGFLAPGHAALNTLGPGAGFVRKRNTI